MQADRSRPMTTGAAACSTTGCFRPLPSSTSHLGFGTAKLISNGVSGLGSAPDPNIDITKWGFDPLIVNNNERSVGNIPPGIAIGDPNRATRRLAARSSIHSSTRTRTVSVAFTKVLSRHTIKVGYEQYLLSLR